MKTVLWKCMILLTVVLMMSACGKSDNNDDAAALWLLMASDQSMITINTQSQDMNEPVVTTYTGKSNTDPALSSIVTGATTVISAIKAGTSSFTITISDGTILVGTHTIGIGINSVSLMDFSSPLVLSYGTESGTVIIDEIGTGEGSFVEGSFDTIADINSNPSNTLRMWGTFKVKRLAALPNPPAPGGLPSLPSGSQTQL